MPDRAPDRLTWTAGIVAAARGERVLEVGCGHGVLLSLLAEVAAVVVGVDRSATMTAAAERRNAAAVAEGRVRLVAAPLTGADLGTEPFDAVVSFNVRAFWTPPAPEWDAVARVLAPAGRVVVAFSEMAPGAALSVTSAVGELAGERGFEVAEVPRAATSPYGSVAVVLRRGGCGAVGSAPQARTALSPFRGSGVGT